MQPRRSSKQREFGQTLDGSNLTIGPREQLQLSSSEKTHLDFQIESWFSQLKYTEIFVYVQHRLQPRNI